MVTCQARLCSEPKPYFPRVEGKTMAEPKFLIDGGTNRKILPPANEVCKGYVFTPVSHSVHMGECLPLVCGEPPGKTPPPAQTHPL